MPDAENQEQHEEWPVHFPNDNCPPEDARDVDDFVSYLVASNPPTANDFLSALERGAFKSSPDCVRAALSCGLTIQYIRQLRSAVPRLGPMKVAAAFLSPVRGKIKQTGNPGHHSLWLRAAVLANAPKLFEVLE